MSQEHPHDEYQIRLAGRRARVRRFARRELLLSLLRFMVFVTGLVMVFAFLRGELTAVAWFLPVVAAFLALMIVHARVIAARQRAERAVDFYAQGLARLEHRWMGTGQRGDRFFEEAHPCAGDLDIFGRGSLFELLCTARTRVGQDALAGWLKAPSEPAALHARQQAVRELIPRLDLREDLAKIIESSAEPIGSGHLVGWANGPAADFPLARRLLAVLLSVLALGALVAWFVVSAGPLPFLIVIGFQYLLFLGFKKQVHRTAEFAEHAERELTAYHVLLRRLEREHFDSPHLRALTACLRLDGAPASRRLRRLGLLVTLLNDGRENKALLPLALLLFWSTHFAWAIERWRRRHGAAVPQWVRLIGEIEALCALAGFAFENPGDVFPEIVAGEPQFEGEGLGHPLLPREKCVCNDLRLGGGGAARLLIVSGSNMSGKSTFLRTVGVNAVLALAGATVRARRLRLSPLGVFTSIRNQDSLAQGYSRFYAEILRIQQTIAAASRGPLLFLIDEIFNGTNSHDRRIAAEAIVRRLAATGAIGMITTHDLALTHIPEELEGAANVHFEDQLAGDRLVFDYRLRPGVIQRGNALSLMRSIGLDV